MSTKPDPKRFVFDKATGESQPVGMLAVNTAAARNLKVGAGAFTVVRAGHYKHPGLSRAAALRMIREMCKTIPVASGVLVRDAKQNPVFHVVRVATSVYDDPFRDCAGLQPLRQDMGVDYSVTRDSPIYAIGPGIVVRYELRSNWPRHGEDNGEGSLIACELTEGPAKGKFYYLAENLTLSPALQVGAHVDCGLPLATLHPQAVNCEIGWATSSGSPLAYGCYNEGDRTAAGDNMSKFLVALGAPAGLTEGRSIRCPLPPGWPSSWDL